MNDTKIVTIVDTGMANLASVTAALIRCGATIKLSENRSDILSARYIVLPGVGSFGAAMNRLRTKNLVEALQERFESGKPTLAICLGLQLMSKASDEDKNISGLGILSTTVKRINEKVKIPQFGWNYIESDKQSSLLSSGYAYFANSYVINEAVAGWVPAYAVYGNRFVAAIERGTQLACQFHPELSGQWGHQLLMNWLKKGERAC